MVTKYKIDAIPTEIDPQGEYTYRDPETGAAALMAPTREGDRLELLLGGLSFAAIARVMGLDLDALARLGGGATDPLTFDGQPIGGATPVPTLALTTAPTLGTIRADMVPLDVPYSEGLATRDPTGPVIVTVSFRFAPSITADQATWDQGVDWTSSLTATGDIIIMRVLYTADGVSRTEYVSTVVQDALAADPALVLQSDNTYRVENVTTETEPFEIEVPPTYPGPYDVDPALFAAGPIPLTAPVIEATGTGVDDVLFVNQDALILSLDSDMFRTRQWARDGAIIDDNDTHTLVPADQGKNITVIETATDVNGTRSVTSAPLAIPAAVTFVPTDLGAKLIGAYDLRDFDDLRQDTAGATAVTAVGQPVRYLRDSGPLGNHFAATATNVPGNAISATGALDWNDAGFIPAAQLTGFTQSMTGLEIYAVLDTEDDAAFTMMGTNGNGARYIGIAANAATVSHGTTTVASYSAGSTIITDMTQAALHAAWVTPTGYVVAGAQGIANLASSVLDQFMPLGVANSASISSANRLNGSVRYLIVTLALTTAERADLVAFLSAMK